MQTSSARPSDYPPPDPPGISGYTRHGLPRRRLAFTVADVAEMFGRKPATIRRWHREDRLRMQRLGRDLIIYRSDLLAAIRGMREWTSAVEADGVERARAMFSIFNRNGAPLESDQRNKASDGD